MTALLGRGTRRLQGTAAGVANLRRRFRERPAPPYRPARPPGRPSGPGTPLVVVAVTAAVGFLLVSQLASRDEGFTQRLEAESEENLARILAGLTDEADALRSEIADLKVQLADLRASTRQDDSAEQAARQQLQSLAVLAGTVPVTGPGLVLVVEDPARAVGYDNLIDTIQELRDAGAEAVAVNGRRVGASTSLAPRDGGVAVDGTGLTPPYRVVAIGQPATLEGGLKIPGGTLDTLHALREVRAVVQRSAKLEVPALATVPSFRTARPVGSAP